MYSLSHIVKGIRNPKLIFRELNTLYHTRGRRRPYNVEGIDVFSEDWDNLLILDAFRYDLFEQLISEYDLSGTLESRISRGTSTPEFLLGNLDGKDLTDTVYATATTMLYRESALKDELEIRLHDIIDVWMESIEYGEFGVKPEMMSELALDTLEEYPNKRLVVHYIQPHIPFLGETGEEHFAGMNSIWKPKTIGELNVSDDILWQAYEENARIALREVASFVSELAGKTVVTADHGQMIGDRSRPFPIKEYGHPRGIYTEELVKVPWFVCEHDQRRKISHEAPTSEYGDEQADKLDEKAQEHLRHLGYVY